MRLTTLEIKGFKSFGDKVTIHFDKGVTAIVGPNGSGKSNVVDAMRWVLGEQKTRMLRSEKMENIIFNGTKNRKPANLAEVSLSFENTKNILPTEYSTVTITRKLYRTGDSEYLLNGVPCRLKDITDLFLDTGIGSDSYSIIELKMIDEIINDKNNTIKSLFEEAAGISKYKVRKKQTLQKLEETDGDLNRVNDLLFEIEKNLKTLESQAKKTERFYRIKEQYKELSTQLASFSIASYKETFEKLQSQEEKLKDDRIHLEAQIDQSEAELQQLKLDNTDNEKHLAASQKALNEKMTLIRQLESEKRVKNERLKFLQDKEASLTQQLINDKKYLAELSDSLKVLELDREKEEETLKQSEILLKELKESVDSIKTRHSSIQTDITGKTREFQSLQEQSHRLEKTFAIQQTQKDALLKEIERIERENASRMQEKEALENQLEPVAILKEQKESELEDLREVEEQLQESIREKESGIKTSGEAMVAVNRKLDARQNEYSLTKSLVDNLEGFPESIKFLKKKAGFMQNAPLLSDIISCSQEYKLPVENYLEPYMNYFVVQNIQEAQQSINLLSEASQGRANFFILDRIAAVEPSGKSIPGSVPALDIIETDTRYAALCSYLLHDVFITEGGGNDIPAGHEEAVLVSRDGKFQKTRVTLSGGSVGLFEGKRIGRAKNLDILDKEIKTLETERIALKEQHDSLQSALQKDKAELAAASARKTGIQNELNRANAQLITLTTRKEQFALNLSNSNKRIDDIRHQLQQLENTGEFTQDAFSEKIERIQADKQQLQEELNSMQSEFRQINEQLSSETGRYNQQNIAFLQQQNKQNTILRELTFKKGQSATLTENISVNTAELEKIKVQVSEIVENTTDSDDSILLLYEEKESLEKAVQETETVYFKARGVIDETENKIRELRKRKDNNDTITQGLKDKVTELKIQLNSLKERLSVEFGVDIESLLDKEPGGELSEAELKDRVEKLKTQIANYGPINPMAIEAYQEINERFTFIVQQKDDLLKAKESLLQTIAEIDATAKEKFMEAFIQIRSNFITVFRSLFSEEDNCDLVLSDPSHPLESDINITAQPKGKRPLSINQLSGGEKTLTATALLFSIYLLKPAPFCIFDEVDAPLDDTNIDKFNKIIKRFSEDSQFIIITHNKRTMASTDIIYGVTMIELGVTQVVPVDMREVA
jgi:chromosome segregation protein